MSAVPGGRWWATLLVATLPLSGCDTLFGFDEVTIADAHSVAGDGSAGVDGSGSGSTGPLVQQIKNYAQSAATLSATLPAPATAGDVLVVVASDPHSNLGTVTGGGVAMWVQAGASTINANVEVWIGVTDGSSSTVTITVPGSTTPIAMLLSEWQGLDTANLVDISQASHGSSSPATAGTATIKVHDVVLFAVADNAPNTFGTPAPGPWTALTGISLSISLGAWYDVVTSNATVSPSVSETAHSWDAALVALRLAS